MSRRVWKGGTGGGRAYRGKYIDQRRNRYEGKEREDERL